MNNPLIENLLYKKYVPIIQMHDFSSFCKHISHIFGNSVKLCASHDGEAVTFRNSGRMVMWKGKLTDQGRRPSGRDRPGQHQKDFPGPVQIDQAWPRTSPCLAEIVHSGSRERFLVMFGNRTSLKYTFYTFGGVFYLKKNTNLREYKCKRWMTVLKIVLR